MSEPYSPPPRKGNPVSQRKHRQEVLWQISLPLMLGILLVLAAGAGVIYAGSSGTGDIVRWASISLIWLILPALCMTLIITLLMAALAYGLGRLTGALPGYTKSLQDIFVLIDARVRKAADSAVEPVLRTHGFFAGLRTLRRKLTRRKYGNREH